MQSPSLPRSPEILPPHKKAREGVAAYSCGESFAQDVALDAPTPGDDRPWDKRVCAPTPAEQLGSAATSSSTMVLPRALEHARVPARRPSDSLQGHGEGQGPLMKRLRASAPPQPAMTDALNAHDRLQPTSPSAAARSGRSRTPPLDLQQPSASEVDLDLAPVAAPAWLPSARWGSNHQIRIFGPIACCTVCGRYAIERVGRGLLEACTGPDDDAKNRVRRMRQGQHPITGKSLTDC